ncbi:MAG: F0F1 ATP synthase subunit delta [Deltaproteobacteria bacterium]|nr:F0F1 ATP synthase subunit delta [Deltaproteobacteria bacterium]MBW2217929.1 F0F1 ATP synthase subunit delta [Deltaproteobacteria bacterium]
MKNLSIARRYAKALMLIAKEDGRAEEYRKELAAVAGLMQREPSLKQAVSNPLYASEGRRNVLEAVIEKAGLSKTMKSFLLLLFDKGRIGFLESINGSYQKLADELKGIARASLVSATKLSSDAVEKIRTSLSKMVGKDIIFDLSQEAGLIGGVVTKIGDLVLDGSIKTQLSNMRQSLKRGESV